MAFAVIEPSLAAGVVTTECNIVGVFVHRWQVAIEGKDDRFVHVVIRLDPDGSCVPQERFRLGRRAKRLRVCPTGWWTQVLNYQHLCQMTRARRAWS